ncbi:carbohydrate ABC transporter permease [Shumkonia mesophila]|uniref:carbohydrate ABC transporter permease n=1 Tax=Shumkonia mesophila TaxID=2838854 RepID=UPI002934226B|nr:sugar ABC transporter permease [Shumkonia mesophila]
MAIWADRWLPVIVLSPSVMISFVFVYVFVLITAYLSFTPSTLMPVYRFVGLARYRELFANPTWWDAVHNLAWFGVLFVLGCTVFGLLLAILMDQRIRAEGAFRSIYLYPLALSQVVAGTAWQWMLNPGYGIEKVVQDLGWAGFHFDWIADPSKAIFCVVIAAVWQSTGFVAALFLAGLRGIDEEIVRAAQIDGASMPLIYRRVILPMIRPVFFSVLLILSHLAIKTFDIVVVMTAGGPGTATVLPSLFMYTYSFERGRLGIGAASAVMMLLLIVTLLVPIMYMESRATRNAS